MSFDVDFRDKGVVTLRLLHSDAAVRVLSGIWMGQGLILSLFSIRSPEALGDGPAA